MSDAPVTVDVGRLREEIRDKYVEVVQSPGGSFHFHTGAKALAKAGYDPAWYAGIPESSIASFAGVANPFHWGLPRPASGSWTWARGSRGCSSPVDGSRSPTSASSERCRRGPSAISICGPGE